jgi:DNA-binding NarL/FixJ family response regulator
MGQKVRLLIIDDNRLFAESIAALLIARNKIEIVQIMAPNSNTFCEVEAHLFDMLLLNSNSIPIITPQLIRKLKSGNNELKIIIYGANAEDENIENLIEAGANRYVLKKASFDELLLSIKNVHEGRMTCSPNAGGKVVHLHCQENRGIALLTPRETRILELIALGLGNKEIAQQLDISIYTVKNHVHNILEKLHVHFRRDAIRYAYFHGLVKKHPAFDQREARSLLVHKTAKIQT